MYFNIYTQWSAHCQLFTAFNYVKFKRYYKLPSIFWHITPCSPLKVNERLREIYRLHLEGERIRQETIMKQVASRASSTLKRRRHVLPKRRLTFNGLHVFISQKVFVELFIITALRTSNLSFQLSEILTVNLKEKLKDFMIDYDIDLLNNAQTSSFLGSAILRRTYAFWIGSTWQEDK
jgi:hypothetical protein